MSVEVHIDDDGRVWCPYGEIARTWVDGWNPGVITGMGPILIIDANIDATAARFAMFDIGFAVTNGIARTAAENGTWVHRLEPAHWRDGVVPDGWASSILLGRWPD